MVGMGLFSRVSTQQVVVIPSKAHEKDANLLLSLLDSATLESSRDDDQCASIVSKDSSNNNALMLILVKSSSTTTVPPQVLVASKPFLESVVEKNGQQPQRQKQVLNFIQLKVSNDEYENTLLICLPGGGSLLVVTPIVVDTSQGRRAVTALLTSSDLTTAITPTEEVSKEDMTEEEEESRAFVTVDIERPQSRSIMERKDTEPDNNKLLKFLTLEVGTLGKNGVITPNFPVNSPTPIPIETDLFKGQMLLVLRPEDPLEDPYWNEKIFSKRKRRYIMQIQGKFKRVPNGILYAGGEVSEQMKLGLVAKGLSSILLKLVMSFNRGVHYSFGDKDGRERSHIVVPAWTFFENLVVTKPGEKPPTLGEPFPETKQEAAARKASGSLGDWNTEDTYSMSYYSMYVDLPRWSIVNVPVAPSIDLRTFWGKSLLNIVMYENRTPSTDKRHLIKDNGYFYSIQFNYVPIGDADQQKKTEGEEVQRDQQIVSDEQALPWAAHTVRAAELTLRRGQSEVIEYTPTVLEEDGEAFEFFDAEEDEDDIVESEVPSFGNPNLSLLAKIDAACPAWIDVIHKNKYIHAYAFNFRGGRTLLRCTSTAQSYFLADGTRNLVWSPRLSSSERIRRHLGEAFSSALESERSKISAFHNLSTVCDSFLKREEPVLTTKRVRMIKLSGFLARAVSDRHWVEEWTKVTNQSISFYHPERLQRSNFLVSLQHIDRVEKLGPDACPQLNGYHFLALHTQGRAIYLMFAIEQVRDNWIEHLSKHCKKQDSDTSEEAGSLGSDNKIVVIDDPADEFLHKSSMWNCKQRRVLNCKSFSFKTGATTLNPKTTIETALRRALNISDEVDESQLQSFLESAAALKDVNVACLNETERKSFFLNLYHVMIMHAFLVLGTPDSSFKWINYFNVISYQCSDDIFSIAELEHCIIRKAMNYPSQFISKWILPKSRFGFALTKADYRINFALNSGSYSNPPFVPIYNPSRLNEQLDESARQYLSSTVSIACNRRSMVSVSLPRVCQWFADDFGTGSTTDVLKRTEKYLTSDQQRLLKSCWSQREGRYVNVSLKYLPFSFECRSLAPRP